MKHTAFSPQGQCRSRTGPGVAERFVSTRNDRRNRPVRSVNPKLRRLAERNAARAPLRNAGVTTRCIRRPSSRREAALSPVTRIVTSRAPTAAPRPRGRTRLVLARPPISGCRPSDGRRVVGDQQRPLLRPGQEIRQPVSRSQDGRLSRRQPFRAAYAAANARATCDLGHEVARVDEAWPPGRPCPPGWPCTRPCRRPGRRPCDDHSQS